MPMYQLAHYQVRPSAVDKMKLRIADFVDYIKSNEPGAEVHLAWQLQEDPTHFVNVFIFRDEAAHGVHRQSEPVKCFEAVHTPELVSEGVDFVDYNWVAGKR